MRKYDFYIDPGHGWMKVKREELKELGVENKITGYSYERGEFVYLEEDGDASIFIDALEGKSGENFEENKHLRQHISDKNSKIRDYSPYKNYSSEEESLMKELKDKMIKCRNWSRAGINRIKNASLNSLIHWQRQYDF